MNGHKTNALRAGGSLVTRERLELHGARALADEELLAILVGANGVEAAGALLEACGNVQQLAHESTGDLARIKGMTPTRAAMVVAGVELGRRTLTRPRPDRKRLSAPREVAAVPAAPLRGQPGGALRHRQPLDEAPRAPHRDRVDRDPGREPRPSPRGLPDRRDAPRRGHRALPQPPLRRPHPERRRRRPDPAAAAGRSP